MHALTLRRPDSAALVDDRVSIRALDPLVVNQIAAGEVIERPASVVKELIENAIDAGATAVTLELDGGGVDRICVIDDGVGIPPDELALALTPHATSKIRGTEDLDHVASLGFRGEALASIASIARLTLLSRVRGGEEAWVIHAEGSGPGDVAPAAAPEGTRIEIRDLFFNTPARRKFLRTAQTERTRCVEWVRHLALAHPAVGFTVRADGRETLSLPRGQMPRDRMMSVLGRELSGQLLEVHVDAFDDARGVLIWGFVGLPAIARPTASGQHVFLNGRVIRDKTVQHAMREAYRGLIEPGRHPTAVIMLEMSPTAVDVNVHPAKLEVRFRDQSMVHQAVLGGIKRALDQADLTRDTRAWSPGGHHGGSHGGTRGAEFGTGFGTGFGGGTDPAFDRGNGGGFGRGPVAGPAQSGRDPAAFAEAVRTLREEAERRVRPVASDDELRAAIMPGGAFSDVSPSRPGRFLQVHNSYIVVEDDAGLLLIDQHALHERVMFQTLLERLGIDGAGGAPKSLESQRLLTPMPAACEAGAIDRLDDLRPLLDRLGIELTPMGPRTVGVQAFPSLLFTRGVDPAAFVVELLEKSAVDGFVPSGEAALHEVLDMMACKAAVKAGDRLSDDEISMLLEQRHKVERSSNCPHGRPTSVRLGLAQLERLFERR